MQLSAVLLARVIFFVESVDLNPRGSAYYPDIIQALVNRYGFQSFPQKLEDFNEEKGVALVSGKSGNRVIERVVIYNWGLTLDTTSSTTDSEELLDEALRWCTDNLRISYKPEMIKRKAYVSQITFYTDVPLLLLNPILGSIAERLAKTVSSNLRLPYVFGPRGIQISVDPEVQRIPVQVFSVERREGVPFADSKYFSAAPVQTDVHIELLSELESALRSSDRSSGARRS